MKSVAAAPFYFGPEGAELFGWMHDASGSSRQGLGVLICNPFGFEEVCSHRSLKHFAESFSSAGFACLRYDHAGCGDSQGDEFDVDTSVRWLRSVHEAIDALKSAGGVSQVIVLGVRLGATLAALACAERSDVAGLIAIAPVVRGRGYVRELTMLGQTGASPMPSGGDALESAGFLLTRETAEFVSRLDLRTLDKPPAPRVLIVERDDLQLESEWEPALEALGVDVRVENWPGYALMMEDAQRAVIPAQIEMGVVTCSQQWAMQLGVLPVLPIPPGHTVSRSRVAVSDVTVVPVLEMPVTIPTGSGTKLFGIVARPESDELAGSMGQRTTVLMLNSGAIHHIGPNRLWVRLARRWAARGLTVLRLDIAGIGDSPARPGAPDNVVYSPHALQDVAAALAYLRGPGGAGECHLVGLCSGAYHSLKAAVAGQDVASSLMINPLTYFWHEGAKLSDLKDYQLLELTSKFRGKFFTREPWLKLLRGQLDTGLVAEVASRRLWGMIAPHLAEVARLLHIPLRYNLASELEAAVERGIRLRFVFAARAPGIALLWKQSGRALQRLLDRQLASIDFVPDADHTFTRLEARERLVALLDRLAPQPRDRIGPST